MRAVSNFHRTGSRKYSQSRTVSTSPGVLHLRMALSELFQRAEGMVFKEHVLRAASRCCAPWEISTFPRMPSREHFQGRHPRDVLERNTS
eukprot:902926-Amphidinium_carterae.1